MMMMMMERHGGSRGGGERAAQQANERGARAAHPHPPPLRRPSARCQSRRASSRAAGSGGRHPAGRQGGAGRQERAGGVEAPRRDAPAQPGRHTAGCPAHHHQPAEHIHHPPSAPPPTASMRVISSTPCCSRGCATASLDRSGRNWRNQASAMMSARAGRWAGAMEKMRRSSATQSGDTSGGSLDTAASTSAGTRSWIFFSLRGAGQGRGSGPSVRGLAAQ